MAQPGCFCRHVELFFDWALEADIHAADSEPWTGGTGGHGTPPAVGNGPWSWACPRTILEAELSCLLRASMSNTVIEHGLDMLFVCEVELSILPVRDRTRHAHTE
jgi:hypothetical protein